MQCEKLYNLQTKGYLNCILSVLKEKQKSVQLIFVIVRQYFFEGESSNHDAFVSTTLEKNAGLQNFFVSSAQGCQIQNLEMRSLLLRNQKFIRRIYLQNQEIFL